MLIFVLSAISSIMRKIVYKLCYAWVQATITAYKHMYLLRWDKIGQKNLLIVWYCYSMILLWKDWHKVGLSRERPPSANREEQSDYTSRPKFTVSTQLSLFACMFFAWIWRTILILIRKRGGWYDEEKASAVFFAAIYFGSDRRMPAAPVRWRG